MRKHKLPDELARLSDDNLKLVNSWLCKHPYATVRQNMIERFGVSITSNKLCRYYQRLRDVEDLNQQSGQTLTVDDLNKIKNGQPLPDGKVNKQLLDYACFKMAQRPNQTTAELKDIFQIAIHEQNAEFARKRLELASRFADLRDRKQALKLLELELLAGSGRPRPQQLNNCEPSDNSPISPEVAQTKI